MSGRTWQLYDTTIVCRGYDLMIAVTRSLIDLWRVVIAAAAAVADDVDDDDARFLFVSVHAVVCRRSCPTWIDGSFRRIAACWPEMRLNCFLRLRGLDACTRVDKEGAGGSRREPRNRGRKVESYPSADMLSVSHWCDFIPPHYARIRDDHSPTLARWQHGKLVPYWGGGLRNGGKLILHHAPHADCGKMSQHFPCYCLPAGWLLNLFLAILFAYIYIIIYYSLPIFMSTFSYWEQQYTVNERRKSEWLKMMMGKIKICWIKRYLIIVQRGTTNDERKRKQNKSTWTCSTTPWFLPRRQCRLSSSSSSCCCCCCRRCSSIA